MQNTRKKYYIENYGCQMNLYDSELVSGILENRNYISTEKFEEADIILLNTCSVREHAEEKVYSRLGQIKGLKRKNSQLKIGVLGCVAKHQKEKILARCPYVDFVLGPDNYRNLETVLNNGETVVDTAPHRSESYDDLIPARKSEATAYISIMRGCNNFCSFCVVPYVRGRERSRSPESIIRETKLALEQGYKEIMLLGQNVNSYHYEEINFPQLLKYVSEIPGKFRVRFTSPHPQDVSTNLIKVMAENSKICKHIHLPLQSGSGRILKLMNRNYSKEEYLSLVDSIRSIIPTIAITTDIIVGFPGESEDDFQDTIDVMNKVKFDNAYMFKYSPRRGTRAAVLPDQIDENVKSARLKRVIELQDKHTSERYRSKIGITEEVLVEKGSKKNSEEMMGRTDDNKIVILKSGFPEKNSFVPVKITGTSGVSLFGNML